MSKRARFVLAAMLLSGLLWGTRLIAPEGRLAAILGLTAFSYVLTVWVLFEDLKGVEWLTLMILPTIYTLGAGVFSLFLPESVARIFGLRLETEVARLLAGIVRGVFWLLFGVGMYALFLTENIFSVAAIRTIQLVRAAHAVGYLLSLVTGLLVFFSVYSLRYGFWVVAPVVGGISFLLFLQGNWSMLLRDGLNRRVVGYSLASAWLMAQFALGLSFWPIKAFTAALVLVSGVYVLLGLSQLRLAERLFKNQVNEYLIVGILVLVAGFLVTSWR